MLKKILAVAFCSIIFISCVSPVCANNDLEPIPNTYLVFDVSSSTAKSKETLKSLYQYLVLLFSNCQYDMNLTILLFDEELLTDPQNIVEVSLGNKNKINYTEKLSEILDLSDKFSRKTAVYESLDKFNSMYISKLNDEEKNITNIVVFSDMKSTANQSRNTDKNINDLYLSWISSGITVKNLVWTDGDKTSSFEFLHSDETNDMYTVDINDVSIIPYEVLFHLYFHTITGGYPENNNKTPENRADNIIYKYPDTYEIYLLTDNPDAVFKSISDSDNKDLITIETEQVFPSQQLSNNQPKVFKINKSVVDKMGSMYLAENLKHLYIYTILSPKISNIKIVQGYNDYLYTDNETSFEVVIDPSIKLWRDMSANSLRVNVAICSKKTTGATETKDEDLINTNEDRFIFKCDGINAFSSGEGKYDITVTVWLKNDSEKIDDDILLCEKTVNKYIVAGGTSTNSDDNGKDGYVRLKVIVVALFFIFVSIFIIIFIIKSKKHKKDALLKKWNL